MVTKSTFKRFLQKLQGDAFITIKVFKAMTEEEVPDIKDEIDDKETLDQVQTVIVDEVISDKDNLANKENIITDIMKAVKERENLRNKNLSLQQKLSMYLKGSEETEYFQTLQLPLGSTEDTFMELLHKERWEDNWNFIKFHSLGTSSFKKRCAKENLQEIPFAASFFPGNIKDKHIA
ncbi:hypothetical protein CEXT_42491 [Caerostris extrusa]|uniref:Uncharacterized protein n=1 Tax=Caerostris extrusa TaxID=172846 RepID=A0AAV4M8Y6_CAEEX|nr:hypothetical protein CEXT_42491 [Caerostris extrusa]